MVGKFQAIKSPHKRACWVDIIIVIGGYIDGNRTQTEMLILLLLYNELQQLYLPFSGWFQRQPNSQKVHYSKPKNLLLSI